MVARRAQSGDWAVKTPSELLPMTQHNEYTFLYYNGEQRRFGNANPRRGEVLSSGAGQNLEEVTGGVGHGAASGYQGSQVHERHRSRSDEQEPNSVGEDVGPEDGGMPGVQPRQNPTQPTPPTNNTTPRTGTKGKTRSRAALRVASLNMRGGGRVSSSPKWEYIN